MKTQVFYDRADKTSNPKKLNIAQLKTFKGCENLSDKEASEKVNSLYKLSLITFNIFKHGT